MTKRPLGIIAAVLAIIWSSAALAVYQETSVTVTDKGTPVPEQTVTLTVKEKDPQRPQKPGHFSEQYASEIPGSGTPGEFVTYKVPFTSDSTAYCTFGEGTSVPGTTIATDDNGSWIPPSSDSGSGQTDIPAGPGTKIGAARQLHSIRLGLRGRWQCRRRPELEQL